MDPAFLDGHEPETQPVALDETRVLVMPRIAFMRLMEERFTVVRGFMAHLAGVVRTLGEADENENEPAPAPENGRGEERRWLKRQSAPVGT